MENEFCGCGGALRSGLVLDAMLIIGKILRLLRILRQLRSLRSSHSKYHASINRGKAGKFVVAVESLMCV